jgi:hypothetical protein
MKGEHEAMGWIQYVVDSDGDIYPGNIIPEVDEGTIKIVCACGHVLRDGKDDPDFNVLAGDWFACHACGRQYITAIIERGQCKAVQPIGRLGEIFTSNPEGGEK